MRNSHCVSLTANLLLVLACGCDALSGPRRDPSKAAPPTVEPVAGESHPLSGSEAVSVPADSAAGPATRNAASDDRGVPQSPDRTAPPSDALSLAGEDEARTPAAAESMRLWAGVALPQSFPTGTVMSFSVDYQFEAGGPRPSYQYLWIIRASGAERPWESVVQLETKGTLQSIVPDWRPEQGPFEAMLVEISPDGDRRPISSAAPLKASDE